VGCIFQTSNLLLVSEFQLICLVLKRNLNLLFLGSFLLLDLSIFLCDFFVYLLAVSSRLLVNLVL
jgi:hypothetical protein